MSLPNINKKLSTDNVLNQAIKEVFNKNAKNRTNALHVLYLRRNQMPIDDKRRILINNLVNAELIKKMNVISDNKVNKLFEEFTKKPNLSEMEIIKIIGVAPEEIFGKTQKNQFLPKILKYEDLFFPRVKGSGVKLLGFEKGKFPKKYNAILEENKKEKKVAFGDQRYEQYKDSTGLNLYSNLNHLDENRKNLYYRRHNKNYPKYSADYFSKKYLW
jgi:hypothetical protein